MPYLRNGAGRKEGRFRVAVLIFENAEDIDFTAPIEVLGQAGALVFTVGPTLDSVTTVFGLHVRPDYDLEHAPQADLIFVPGGGVNKMLKDDRVISWIRQRANGARYVMSVCNGAFILGKAGLLDNMRATTTASLIDALAVAAPKTRVVRERVVDNGKVITTAGLSAGIDGALHVIEREYGRTRAEDVARGIEYRWQPDSHWTRASLADIHLPDITLPADSKWKKLVSHGDTRQWKMSGLLQVTMPANDFLDYGAKQITANGWTLHNSGNGKRIFVQEDRDGHTWLTTLEAQPDGDAIRETMTIRRVEKPRTAAK